MILLLKTGNTLFFLHKKDILKTLTDFDSSFNQDNSGIGQNISAGKLHQVDLKAMKNVDIKLHALITNEIACYLLLKGKMTIIKSDTEMKEIRIEEAPPEAELDNVVRNVYFFYEVGIKRPIFNGKLRTNFK